MFRATLSLLGLASLPACGESSIVELKKKVLEQTLDDGMFSADESQSTTAWIYDTSFSFWVTHSQNTQNTYSTEVALFAAACLEKSGKSFLQNHAKQNEHIDSLFSDEEFVQQLVSALNPDQSQPYVYD